MPYKVSAKTRHCLPSASKSTNAHHTMSFTFHPNTNGKALIYESFNESNL